MQREGFQGWHEHAIAQGHAPIRQSQLIEPYGKLPDGLLVKGKVCLWVETESSPKGIAELERACALAAAVGRPMCDGSDLELGAIVFVYIAQYNHAAGIARACRSLWTTRYSNEMQAKLASNILLARVTCSLPLVWHSCTTSPLTLPAPKVLL